jgi:hypothetical protein
VKFVSYLMKHVDAFGLNARMLLSLHHTPQGEINDSTVAPPTLKCLQRCRNRSTLLVEVGRVSSGPSAVTTCATDTCKVYEGNNKESTYRMRYARKSAREIGVPRTNVVEGLRVQNREGWRHILQDG